MVQPQDVSPFASGSESAPASAPPAVVPEVPADGLSSSEAQARLAKYGYNELPEEKTNTLLKFLSYFWGPSRG